MNKLQPSETAPRDGTLILVSINNGMLLPAMWCLYHAEWAIAHPQINNMDAGFRGVVAENYFETEHYSADDIEGWKAIPY